MVCCQLHIIHVSPFFFSFFRPDTELVIVFLGYEGRHFAAPARLSSCHIAPEEALMNGLSFDADGIAGGKPYQVPRAHPLLLQSTPFLPAAIQVLAHASSFVPRSHPSMWLTSNPPTPYDALRSHHQTLIQTMIAACQAAHNGDLEALQHLLSEGVNLNVPTTTATPLYLAAPTPEPRHSRRSNISVRLNIFLLSCILGWEGRCSSEYFMQMRSVVMPGTGVRSPFSYQMGINCNAVEVECSKCGEE